MKRRIGARGVAGGRAQVLGEGAVDLVGDKAKREKKAEHGLDLEDSELFFVFKIFSRHDAKVRKKLMCRRMFYMQCLQQSQMN
jgi:hypothetical protein